MKITRTADKVLFWTNSGIKTFSQECNIFPHPRNEKQILISEIGTSQEESESFPVDFDNIENYASVSFAPASRDAMIEILASRYFNLQYKIDATQFFDTIGDGSGTKVFTGDYSGAVTKGLIKPNGRAMTVNRVVVFIETSTPVGAGKYGAMNPLTNGIFIKHEKQTGDLIKDITDGLPIKTNGDFGKFGFQVSDISFGTGLNYVHVVLTFCKNGTGLTLAADEQLAIHFNDSFTALSGHTFRAGAFYLE